LISEGRVSENGSGNDSNANKESPVDGGDGGGDGGDVDGGDGEEESIFFRCQELKCRILGG
jgi:hypothetical protein